MRRRPQYFCKHPEDVIDPLSDILSLVRPRSYGAGAFDMGTKWALQFPHFDGIKCYAVASGQCWLSIDGISEPLLLRPGECFLLPQGRPFRLASDLRLDAVMYDSLPRLGGIASSGGGGECFIVGGHFTIDKAHAVLLTGILPSVVLVRGEADRETLRWSLELMRQELLEQKPGALLIAQHLAHVILIQALRLAVTAEAGGMGWLAALADRQISIAIAAVHNDPAHRWTLPGLAERAGMSRSGFAEKFKSLVGQGPIQYVTRWRMMIASDRLLNSDESISRIAAALGFGSESSFSTAFKGVMACSPRKYRRAERRPYSYPAPAAD